MQKQAQGLGYGIKDASALGVKKSERERSLAQNQFQQRILSEIVGNPGRNVGDHFYNSAQNIVMAKEKSGYNDFHVFFASQTLNIFSIFCAIRKWS